MDNIKQIKDSIEQKMDNVNRHFGKGCVILKSITTKSGYQITEEMITKRHSR